MDDELREAINSILDTFEDLGHIVDRFGTEPVIDCEGYFDVDAARVLAERVEHTKVLKWIETGEHQYDDKS